MIDLVILNVLLTACVVISAGALGLSIWAVLDARKARRMGEEGIRAMREAMAVLRAKEGPLLTPAVQRLERAEVDAPVVAVKKASPGKPKMFRPASEDEKWAAWVVRHPDQFDAEERSEASRIYNEFQKTKEVA